MVCWMNISQQGSSEKEGFNVGVLCTGRLLDQCCCFIGNGPEGRSCTSWEIDQRIGLKLSVICVLRFFLEGVDEDIWGRYESKRIFIVRTPIEGDKSKTTSNWYKVRWEILAPRTDQSRDRTDIGLSRVSKGVIRTQLLFSLGPDETPAQKLQVNI